MSGSWLRTGRHVPDSDTNPGAGRDFGSFFIGNEDWAIWGAAYYPATFYYNEGWLEGLASRNHSLQTAPIVGRYYNVTGDQILYYTLAHHYAGDIVQMTHIWATSGYNHVDYEVLPMTNMANARWAVLTATRTTKII